MKLSLLQLHILHDILRISFAIPRTYFSYGEQIRRELLTYIEKQLNEIHVSIKFEE